VQVGVPEVGRLAPRTSAGTPGRCWPPRCAPSPSVAGPSEAELDFIADLAVARARQQVPIQAVLTAVHVASRPVWQRPGAGGSATCRSSARRRRTGPLRGVGRAGPCPAHRRAPGRRARPRPVAARPAGRAAAAGARGRRRGGVWRSAEAGLPPGGPLWVVHNEPADDAAAGQLEQRLRQDVHDLFGRVDDALVGVVAAPGRRVEEPSGSPDRSPDELDVAALWARWAHAGAGPRTRGSWRSTRSPVEAALVSRPALGHAVAASRLARRSPTRGTSPTRSWPDRHRLRRTRPARRRDGRHLFVHPNTVRHRLRRFTELTGFELDSTFGIVAAWWAARSWMARR
jgi:hypothetical protein